ncbi:hypothetical protein IC615_17710 [Serratia ureilytica]
MQRQLWLQAQFLEEQRSEQRVAFGFLALGASVASWAISSRSSGDTCKTPSRNGNRAAVNSSTKIP